MGGAAVEMLSDVLGNGKNLSIEKGAASQRKHGWCNRILGGMGVLTQIHGCDAPAKGLYNKISQSLGPKEAD